MKVSKLNKCILVQFSSFNIFSFIVCDVRSVYVICKSFEVHILCPKEHLRICPDWQIFALVTVPMEKVRTFSVDGVNGNLSRIVLPQGAPLF